MRKERRVGGRTSDKEKGTPTTRKKSHHSEEEKRAPASKR
jgi:hypothetical protein